MPREDLASEGYQKASSQVRAVEQRLGGAWRQVLPPSLPLPSSAHPPDHLKHGPKKQQTVILQGPPWGGVSPEGVLTLSIVL